MEAKINRESPRIGEIYCMKFDGMGSEQRGVRPGLVIQNNIANQHSPNVIALPLTSKIKKEIQPTHVVLPEEIGLKRDSIVLCENPERMSKNRMGAFITKVPLEYMKKVAVACLLATSVIAFVDSDTLKEVQIRATELNLSCYS